MGLKINITAKTKVMRFNAVNDEKGMVNGEDIKNVDSFVYLEAKVTTMTRRKNHALQEPPVVPYKALGNFPKALYGTTGGTCSARFFRHVC